MTSQLSLAKGDKPLLMANKKNLYQRVLALPDAVLYTQTTDDKQSTEELPVFSVYYVYSRKTEANNQKWLNIGLGRYGKKLGWVKENKTIEWSQRLTLTFRKPEAGQDRVLLFKDKASAEKLATNPNKDQYRQVYQAASQGKELANSPVVAIQPAENIDIRKDFYLIPIHSYEEIFMKNSTARLLQVSSIPLLEEYTENASQAKPSQGTKQVSSQSQVENKSDISYAAAITFVVDSTLSMQPYINRTRKAVKKIFNDIKKANLLGDVSFGLVAYRDNIEVAPDIEYVTKPYVNLKQGRDPNVFMQRVSGLKATHFSSKDFIEDGFAGVYKALDEMDWKPFAARYIVLITDAGSRDFNDPLSSTGKGLKELRAAAQEKNVAIFVMHLLTAESVRNHPAAKKQYKSLSEYPGIGDFYYGVPMGNTGEFGQVIESISTQITAQVGLMKKGNEMDVAVETIPEEAPQLQDLKTKVDRLGYAMRMSYLKNQKGEKAPDVFKAWLVDKDFADPEKRTVDVRVLLTRNQLSDLYIILKQVLDTAEKGVISPNNFLNELKSLAATTSRDPEQLGGTTATTAGKGNSLAEMGFMREYIEGLPYTGQVMSLSLDDWQSWSVKRQIEFLQGLEEKINYYRNLHDNIDLWVSLRGGSIDGDSVFPVPLDKLP
jgi:hypothetical protein